MSLRKEMLIAIGMGLLLGGAAAFGMVKLPGAMQPAENTPPSPTTSSEIATPLPTSFVSGSLSLDILLPENQSLSQEASVTVSGKTKPGITVAISSPIDEAAVQSDKEGAFSQQIKLTEGSNELVLMATDGTNEIEKRIIVSYTSEEL